MCTGGSERLEPDHCRASETLVYQVSVWHTARGPKSNSLVQSRFLHSKPSHESTHTSRIDILGPRDSKASSTCVLPITQNVTVLTRYNTRQLEPQCSRAASQPGLGSPGEDQTRNEGHLTGEVEFVSDHYP